MKTTNVVYLAIKRTELCNKPKNKSPISSDLLMHQPTGPTVNTLRHSSAPQDRRSPHTPQHLRKGESALTSLNTGSHL